MPESVIVIDKKPGQTPLDCINELKIAHPEWKHIPMTYAGRLDPLASGILLILTGDECLKKDEYMALPKEYEVTVLFGVATDTYDVMGKITSESLATGKAYSQEEIQNAVKNFIGRITQAYPPYSSRTVDGKPLFQWAREGKLNEISIPSHDVFVESIDVLSLSTITGARLHNYITSAVSSVAGDFRQTDILNTWNDTLENNEDSEFHTIKLRIRSGSGAYMRSIAHELGVAFGVPALALKIVRTKIGEYTI